MTAAERRRAGDQGDRGDPGGPVGPVDPYVPERGSAEYRVDHYDLTLDYKVDPNLLDGVARLNLTIVEPVEKLALDLAGLRVSAASIDGRKVRWQQRRHKLELVSPALLPAGATVEVMVRYRGNPKPVASTWGPVGWEPLDEGVVVASQPMGPPPGSRATTGPPTRPPTGSPSPRPPPTWASSTAWWWRHRCGAAPPPGPSNKPSPPPHI